jgi:hypothetical protein
MQEQSEQVEKVPRHPSNKTLAIRAFVQDSVKEGSADKRGLFKAYKESEYYVEGTSPAYFTAVLKDRAYQGAIRVSQDGKSIQAN